MSSGDAQAKLRAARSSVDAVTPRLPCELSAWLPRSDSRDSLPMRAISVYSRHCCCVPRKFSSTICGRRYGSIEILSRHWCDLTFDLFDLSASRCRNLAPCLAHPPASCNATQAVSAQLRQA